jgi:hypothetical protein
VATLDMCQQALVMARSRGDRRNEGLGLVNQGWSWLGVGDLAQAERDLEMGLKLTQANGDRGAEDAPLCALSTLALWQGADTRALALARSALDIAVAVGGESSRQLPCSLWATLSWLWGDKPRRSGRSSRRRRVPSESAKERDSIPQ